MKIELYNAQDASYINVVDLKGEIVCRVSCFAGTLINGRMVKDYPIKDGILIYPVRYKKSNFNKVCPRCFSEEIEDASRRGKHSKLPYDCQDWYCFACGNSFRVKEGKVISSLDNLSRR